MKEILSTKNTLVKEIKKLHKKKYREEAQQYIIEGFHLIEEATASTSEIIWILYNKRGASEWSGWLAQQNDKKKIVVTEDVLAYLSELPTPQGIIAVVKMPQSLPHNIYLGKWLLLDNIQDPGNVGTMIRTADAAGLTGVILGEGTTDIYQTKVLRAMQGSNYHLPIIKCPLADAIDILKEQQVPIYATELNLKAIPYHKIEPSENYALLVGNEGKGLAEEWIKKADRVLYIPMKGKAESLNVAIAAGILMFWL